MSELKLLPCPICGMELQIHGPENWHPTFYDPDSGGDPYNAVRDCGFSFSTGTYDYEEFVVALNRRAKPKECPALERVEGGIPYCSDKQTACDGCPGYVAPTNAGRIRSMSDEELAAFLEGLVIVAIGDYSLRDNKRRLDWLRQPAEEADHA